MNYQGLFDILEAFKLANPWYDRTIEIIRQYDEIAKTQKPQYITMTGDSTLPWRRNANGNWEQYAPQEPTR